MKEVRNRSISARQAVPQILILILLALFAIQIRADEVTLKSGRKIKGRLIESSEKQIVLETFAGKRTIPVDRMAKHDKKKVSEFEKYEKQIDSLSKDAKGQIKLAKMCIEGEGWQRAGQHLQKALELEPENKEAQKTLKTLEKKEKEYLEKLPKPRAITARIGVKQDLPEKEVKALGEEVKKASKLLARISAKEIYIAEVIFTVPSTTGDLVFDKTFTGLPSGWSNIPMGVRNWGAKIIAHEFCHACLHINDCDDAGSNMANWGKSKSGQPCLMAHNWDAGFCSICSKALGLGTLYAELLPEEIPEPPETKVTIQTPPKK